MYRLSQAGLVAACAQLVAVILGIGVLLLVAGNGQVGSIVSEAPHFHEASAQFLKWTFLVTAFGIALTANRFVDRTASRIRQASRLMAPTKPDQAANTLFASLGFTTAGFAILALRLPSEVLPMPDDQMETSGLVAIIWSGLMSIGVAGFGANTYATWKAMRG